MSVTHVIAVEVMTADSVKEEHVIEAVREGLAMTIDFDNRGLRVTDVRSVDDVYESWLEELDATDERNRVMGD